MDLYGLQKAVFSVEPHTFESLALEIFRYQSSACEVYRKYLDILQINIAKISKSAQIPFLPISFFKDFKVKSGNFDEQLIFTSSSTTGTGTSSHAVRDAELYIESFTRSFNHAFGDYTDFVHLALLPSYLEREGSSLIYQVNYFIENSKRQGSKFYLYDHENLYLQLMENEKNKIPTILWGVTYALLDFAEKYKPNLRYCRIIETGGMKGKRKEIVRNELHEILNAAFETDHINGEYGMTELMSQAYSLKDGLYKCPAWMRLSAREINDPFDNKAVMRNGVLNIIDLANLDSCCFIASSDLGTVYADGSFEVLGRIDHSDTRGCNLLIS